MTQPHWEHGYRVHGYWLGDVRIGWVGLPPGRGSWKTHGYGWGLDAAPIEGRAATLRAAKKKVEREHRRRVEQTGLLIIHVGV